MREFSRGREEGGGVVGEGCLEIFYVDLGGGSMSV